MWPSEALDTQMDLLMDLTMPGWQLLDVNLEAGFSCESESGFQAHAAWPA